MSTVVDAACAACRLGRKPDAYPHRFTVDRAQALQRQRHRPGSTRWTWTLQILRALFALTDGAQVIVSPPRAGNELGLRIRFAFDATTLVGVAPESLLDAALEPDTGAGDGNLAHRQRRFLRLLARGVNESLAFGPCRVAVRLGTKLHSFDIEEDGSGVEHVDDVAADAETAASPLEIEVVIERLVGRWFEAFLGRDPYQVVLRLWFERVPGLDFSGEVGVLRPVPQARALRLGTLGSWWPTNDPRGLLLLRDGVLLPTTLGRDLATLGVPTRDFSGVIEVPRLRLTFDEASIVLDSTMSTLVAWLGDVHAHASRFPTQMTLEDFFSDRPQRPRYDGRIVAAIWPPVIERVQMVDGHWMEVDALRRAAARGVEIAYCWTHERASTPDHVRSTTVMLWPRELDALNQIPGMRLVPVAALHVGAIRDWGALTQVSYPELALGTIARSHDIPVRIEVAALVHRRPEAREGRIELAARGSVIAEIRDPRRVLPGVVLVGRVSIDDAAVHSFGASAQQAALRAIELHARARIDTLVAHARAHDHDDDDAPLLRAVETDGEAALATAATEAIRRSADLAPPLLRVDVVHREYGGTLQVRPPGEHGVIEVWLAGHSCSTIALEGAWGRVVGDVAVQSPATRIDRDTIEQLVRRTAAPSIDAMWTLARPGSAQHLALAELASPARQDVAPPPVVEPLPPAPIGTRFRDVLAAIVGPPGVQFRNELVWKPASRTGADTIVLAMLHPWIVAAQVHGAPRYELSIAAMLSVMALAADPLELEAAMLRYLAAFAHPH